jgi:glycosyltransferase involved in cell wall biosynthesis
MRERYKTQLPIVCRYSVVVPMHNEEGNVEPLTTRLVAAMNALGEPYELLFVDDGSTDGTFAKLTRMAEQHTEVRIVKLKRNFGQTPALAAGFDNAAGEIIIAMDGDLRSDPAEIPLLLEKLDEGYDIANGWRKQRTHEGFFRTFPSRVANRWLGQISGVDIRDFGTTFKAYRREVVEHFRLYGEQHRYLPVLAAWQGAKIAEVPVSDSAREFGKSHYGFGRTLRVPFDLMTLKFLQRYRTAPLRLFGVPGVLSLLAGACLAVFAFLKPMLSGNAPFAGEGIVSIIAAVLLVSGAQLVAMGLLGEMLALSYMGPQREPSYRVERIVIGADELFAQAAARAKSAGSQ